MCTNLTLCILENLETGTLVNSEGPDVKQPAGLEKHHNLENSTFEPLKYTMGSLILIVSIFMGKSIRIQRVKQTINKSNARFSGTDS